MSAELGRLDPTPDDMIWGRGWVAGKVPLAGEQLDEFVLIGVRVWLDAAAKEAAAGNGDGADRLVRRARALIAALSEHRDGGGAR